MTWATWTAWPAIEAALPPGVYVTGSPYRGVGLPDCAKQASETVANVLAGLARA